MGRADGVWAIRGLGPCVARLGSGVEGEWRLLGGPACVRRCARLPRNQQNFVSSVSWRTSELEPVLWWSRPLRKRQPTSSFSLADARAKSSLVGPLLSAQRNEAQERLAESIGLIARLPRLATSRGIVKFALSVSLPLIRARKSLRDSASPNSSAQRYTKAAFRQSVGKSNNGQQQRERPDPRARRRVHDQAPVHGYEKTPAVAAAPGLSSTYRTRR